MRYTDFVGNQETVEKAAKLLEHVWDNTQDEDMATTMVQVNAELMCHAFELLLEMCRTYELYSVGQGVTGLVVEAPVGIH